jgi:hypothetical protein
VRRIHLRYNRPESFLPLPVRHGREGGDVEDAELYLPPGGGEIGVLGFGVAQTADLVKAVDAAVQLSVEPVVEPGCGGRVAGRGGEGRGELVREDNTTWREVSGRVG